MISYLPKADDEAISGIASGFALAMTLQLLSIPPIIQKNMPVEVYLMSTLTILFTRIAMNAAKSPAKIGSLFLQAFLNL